LILRGTDKKNPCRLSIRIFFALFFWSLLYYNSFAQPVQLRDSLNGVFKEGIQPNAHWDTWSTYIYGKSLNIQSLKIGALFGKKMEIGLAYNWLANGVYFNEKFENTDYRMQYELRYYGVYSEVKFFKRNRWSGTLPTMIGSGTSYFQFRDIEDRRMEIKKNPVFVFEPSIRFNYNVANLIQVGAGMGYRIMLKKNVEMEERVISPNFLLTVGFVPDGWWNLWLKLKNR
jgi:hypothetical protein